jgi:hypothetical protein
MKNICSINTCFKSIKNINEDLILNIVESNLKMFLDWSFLCIGAWFDAKIPDNTIYGGTQHYRLFCTEDPSYEVGQVWQSIRKDWVWEYSASFNNLSPIKINGLYVNNKFIDINSNKFYINYPEGKVVFSEPLSCNDLVLVNYSYRYVQVYRANDCPWFTLLQQSSFNTNNPDIKQQNIGEWSVGPHHRVQMPSIIIEALSRSRSRPHEIGNNSLITEQDIAFHVFAENRNDRNKILDILRLQQDIVLYLYDTNAVSSNEDYPLNFNNDLKPNALTYPNLVEKYKWKKCWIKNIGLIDILSSNPNLHQGIVKCTAEIIYA